MNGTEGESERFAEGVRLVWRDLLSGCGLKGTVQALDQETGS